MKRCPKCNIEYFDVSLEYCLEDGARLFASSSTATAKSVVTQSDTPISSTEKTFHLPFSSPAETLDFSRENPVKTIPQADLIKEKVVQQSTRILEIAPFVIALAHNWWQWIYLNNQYYSSFYSYVLSANFLIWMLLLITGAVSGLIAIKRCRNKGFVFASLVILSINLILFLVPKR